MNRGEQPGSPMDPMAQRADMLHILAGVDGCRGGWLVASADTSLSMVRFECVPTGRLDRLVAEAAAGRAIVAIDMPIGLWSAGDRPCDRAARKLLGRGRSSSVFPPPAGATVAANPATYLEACRINLASTGGRALSRQAMNILPKIREIDGYLTDARIAGGIQRAAREAHPELVFAILQGASGGLRSPKRSRAGLAERCRLLEPHLPPFDPAEICRGFPGRPARPDDVVDAAACLVAADRIRRGEALVLSSDRDWLDPRGLRLEIVA